jgi:uncharacterized protein YbcV (DUF1398 family)
MDKRVPEECMRLSMAGGTPFPEIVRRLAEAGVESYYTDLIELRKVHYGPNGEAHSVSIPLTGRVPIADRFDEPGVKEALRRIQTGKIEYPEFLRAIVAAGVMSYSVFIAGRRAIYTGRKGEQYVELFPGSK